MIWRIVSAMLVVWLLGFVLFAVTLPRPLENGVSDVVIVPTGGAGRIERGLEVIDRGYARELFVSGVDPEVRAEEFAEQFDVSAQEMDCCVTLGFDAVDTRSNAREAANWLEQRGVRSVRLVTSDWHMPRVYAEFRSVIPSEITIVQDATVGSPSLSTLFLEYHKFLASRIAYYTGL
ncbi:YdcF family protein [Altererythrobacter aurantiacus]|uniref:YdcF family protein n=1 Tax=Parapontixanthobacter aurantiacus TaxID=1463599 RepID=A0A844ZIG9_9SPHN|nr:YdcF family protein [Parapontixanthobacter aurantiacus]MXO86936.1 YdcF family protein [Parapontixanthobacter aurantiacus]